jgi:LPXTG-site transpeptidase (sortase) family protein
VNLRKINNLLLVLIIVINGYIIIGPLIPDLIFHWQSHSGKKQALQNLIKSVPKTATNPVTVAPSRPNQVIIPSMLLDQPIYDGPESQQYKILNKGIWRFSWGSTPDKGGNTVLIGHRFTYTIPRGVFYFMNKVQLGDEIGVIWNNQQYNYQVVSINEVPPADTGIEGRSKQAELTLFTCTPLWLPKDRLVVVADLESPL